MSCAKQEVEFQLVQKCLETLQHGYSEKWVVRRETECSVLQQVLEKSLGGPAQIVYVSGPPGTGKTSTVRQLLMSITSKVRFKKRLRNSAVEEIYINGGSISSVKSLFNMLCLALKLSAPMANQVDETYRKNGFDAALDAAFSADASEKLILLAIDEVDCLSNLRGLNRPTFLTRLWTVVRDRHNLCLITMSNALSRGTALQRNSKKYASQITCLSFGALTEEQMLGILDRRISAAKEDLAAELAANKTALKVLNLPCKPTAKAAALRYLDQFPVISLPARVLMCKRLATALGDCRSLLNVAKEHLSLQREILEPQSPNGAEPPASPQTPPTAATVTLATTQKLLSRAAGGGSCSTLAAVTALPLEQQLLLLALCKTVQAAEAAVVPLTDVKESLRNLCEGHGVPSTLLGSPILTASGLSGLSTAGFVTEPPSTASRGSGKKRAAAAFVELTLLPEEVDEILCHVRGGALQWFLET